MKLQGGVQGVQLFVKLEGGTELVPLGGINNLLGTYNTAGTYFVPTPIVGFDPLTFSSAQTARVLRLNADNIDVGLADPKYFGVAAASFGYGYDGTNADRIRTASTANFDPANVPQGVQMVQAPGAWSQQHEPAVNVVATTTKAADATRRHVCTSISGSLVCVAAVAAPLYLRLRDGAAGAGTILWSCAVIGLAGTCVPINIGGLNIVGSAATAMTLEFSAAPGGTNFETVALSGVTI